MSWTSTYPEWRKPSGPSLLRQIRDFPAPGAHAAAGRRQFARLLAAHLWIEELPARRCVRRVVPTEDQLELERHVAASLRRAGWSGLRTFERAAARCVRQMVHDRFHARRAVRTWLEREIASQAHRGPLVPGVAPRSEQRLHRLLARAITDGLERACAALDDPCCIWHGLLAGQLIPQVEDRLSDARTAFERAVGATLRRDPLTREIDGVGLAMDLLHHGFALPVEPLRAEPHRVRPGRASAAERRAARQAIREWTASLSTTAPLDRDSARAAVRRWCDAYEVPVPAYEVWLQSPAQLDGLLYLVEPDTLVAGTTVSYLRQASDWLVRAPLTEDDLVTQVRDTDAGHRRTEFLEGWALPGVEFPEHPGTPAALAFAVPWSPVSARGYEAIVAQLAPSSGAAGTDPARLSPLTEAGRAVRHLARNRTGISPPAPFEFRVDYPRFDADWFASDERALMDAAEAHPSSARLMPFVRRLLAPLEASRLPLRIGQPRHRHTSGWYYLAVQFLLHRIRAAGDGADRLAGDMAIALHCGEAHKRGATVVYVERPRAIRRDALGRFHCEHAPAIEYRDGWGQWFLEGVEVPAVVVHAPETVPADVILAESNADVRRLMIERCGWERFLAGARATVVDDEPLIGTLYRVHAPPQGDEPLTWVRVVNATVTPGRGRRAYFLQVPPTVTTAREAVAWTFGITEREYRPVQET